MRSGFARGIVVATATATAGCFALFALDGYGPPQGDDPGADALVADAEDVATPDAGLGDAKVVFVTSETYPANFHAAVGADKECVVIALRAGFPAERDFKAWVSDDVSSPSDRFAAFLADAAAEPLSLRMLDGTLVAASYAELADAGPRAPIVVTERGTTIAASDTVDPTCPDPGGGSFVWTNTTPAGTSAGDEHCGGWSSTDDSFGRAGNPIAKAIDWTNECVIPCTGHARLYCFEQ